MCTHEATSNRKLQPQHMYAHVYTCIHTDRAVSETHHVLEEEDGVSVQAHGHHLEQRRVVCKQLLVLGQREVVRDDVIEPISGQKIPYTCVRWEEGSCRDVCDTDGCRRGDALQQDAEQLQTWQSSRVRDRDREGGTACAACTRLACARRLARRGRESARGIRACPSP